MGKQERFPKEKICCVCLKIGSGFNKCTERDNNNIPFLSKLRTCIWDVKWLPLYYLCTECTTTLNIVYSFKQQCVNSDLTRRRQEQILFVDPVDNIQDDINRKKTSSNYTRLASNINKEDEVNLIQLKAEVTKCKQCLKRKDKSVKHPKKAKRRSKRKYIIINNYSDLSKYHSKSVNQNSTRSQEIPKVLLDHTVDSGSMEAQNSTVSVKKTSDLVSNLKHFNVNAIAPSNINLNQILHINSTYQEYHHVQNNYLCPPNHPEYFFKEDYPFAKFHCTCVLSRHSDRSQVNKPNDLNLSHIIKTEPLDIVNDVFVRDDNYQTTNLLNRPETLNHTLTDALELHLPLKKRKRFKVTEMWQREFGKVADLSYTSTPQLNIADLMWEWESQHLAQSQLLYHEYRTKI